jgi:4-azaleucine resistance transporter AzlC
MKSTFKKTLPVALGYIPFGITSGILLTQLGYEWYWSALMGLIVFAGAAQFMAVGLLAAHAGLLEIFVSTLLINSRHIFYGLTFLKRFPKKGLLRQYLIFSLTDETYSLLSTPQSKHLNPSSLAWIAFFNHMYWAIGCTLGGLLGAIIQVKIPGLEFAMVAFFIVLGIEQYKTNRSPELVVAASLSAIVALALTPKVMLLISMSLCCLIILAKGKLKGWRHE